VIKFLILSEFYGQQKAAVARDKYKEYYKTSFQYCDKSLELWGTRREKYFVLSMITLNILSIPLMFVKCERVFPSTKILLTDRRNRLKEDIIETCTLIMH